MLMKEYVRFPHFLTCPKEIPLGIRGKTDGRKRRPNSKSYPGDLDIAEGEFLVGITFVPYEKE